MLLTLAIPLALAQPTVAITDLANHTGDPAFDAAGPGVAGILVARFVETDAVRVIERRALVSLLDEHQLTVSGLTDPRTAVRAGALLGADYLVVGELFSVQLPTVSVALRVVDTETGEVVASEEEVGEVGARGERFFELVDALSDDILAAVDVTLSDEERASLSAIERRELDAVLRYGEALTRVRTEHPMALYRDTGRDFSRDRYHRTHWQVYEQDGRPVPMPELARRVGDVETSRQYMEHMTRLRRRARRNNLVVAGYAAVGVGLVAAGASGGDDGPTELQWTGFALVAAAPFHLVVNLLADGARRQTARFPGTYYTPDEMDRWIHAYNSSL